MATMRAAIVREHGDLEALRFEDVERPVPEAGQVLVQVRACGINHLDVWVRRGVPGHTFPLPLIPGNDVAGRVVEAPAQTDLAVGDEVIVAPGVSCGHCRSCLSGRDHHCRDYGILGEHRHGGCAEYICVPRANVLPKPAGLSFVEAAALGIPFLTAWHMLVDRAGLRPGETVLVQAGMSGVGSAAIQIAKLWGARVLTTAGSAEKLAAAAALGADAGINYREEDVAARVKELTGRRGVDVVVEHTGEATWEGSLRSLGWQGRLVTCGATTGANASVNLRALFFKSLSILGSTMGSRGDFCEILEHAAAGRLRPVVHGTLPLGELRDAHRALEERTVLGKLVILPNEG